MALSCGKKMPALLRGMTSKHHGDFYSLNCLHSFETKKKLQSNKKVCENKGFCNIAMPSEDNKISEFNGYKNLMKRHLLFMQVLNA